MKIRSGFVSNSSSSSFVVAIVNFSDKMKTIKEMLELIKTNHEKLWSKMSEAYAENKGGLLDKTLRNIDGLIPPKDIYLESGMKYNDAFSGSELLEILWDCEFMDHIYSSSKGFILRVSDDLIIKLSSESC